MKKGISETEFNITEKQFLSQVIDLLRMFNWKFEHTFEQGVYAKRTSKGFPDIVAVRNGLCLFIELKSEKGRLTPSQEEWMNELYKIAEHSLGVMAFVWRPSQLETEILEVLR